LKIYPRLFNQYTDQLGLDREDAAIIARDNELSEFYEVALEVCDSPTLLANWLTNKVLGIVKGQSLSEFEINPQQFGRFINLLADEAISSKAADKVFEKMLETGEESEKIVERLGLRQIADENALEPIVDEVLSSHPNEVERYRDGKTALLGFFMGQIMQKTRGTAKPESVKEILTDKLKGE